MKLVFDAIRRVVELGHLQVYILYAQSWNLGTAILCDDTDPVECSPNQLLDAVHLSMS